MTTNKGRWSEAERAERRREDRERLQRAAEQLLCSEGWRRWVKARSSNGLARYSLTNQLLVALQSDGRATFVAGFKQWLALGYCVKRGSRALRIMAPMSVKARDSDSGGERDETLVLFKTVGVFSQAQVEPLPCGEPTPLEPPRQALTGDSHAHLLPRLVAFCQRLGYSVSFEQIDGPAGGWCDRNAMRIVVDTGVAANAQLRTLVHETAHALGVDYQQYSREQSEVLADTICFVACSSVGLAVDGESVAYVAGWGEDGALEAVTQFAATIDALARRIEDALNTDLPVRGRGVGSPIVAITHYPPVDKVGAQRLRDATVAWAALLGELMAVGLRPYLELEQGERDDPLRLFCELDDGLLVDVSLGDEGLPDAPPTVNEVYWTAFVQADDGYLAEVTIDESIAFDELAEKLRGLVDAVAAGERPFLDDW